MRIRIPRPAKLRHLIAVKIRHSPIGEEESERVLSVYDLGRLEGYRRPAVGHTRSQNLILQTNKGAKLLKRYKTSLDREAIAYEHSVLMRLDAAKFPAPRLVANREGETCTELDGRYYAITDFIEGFKYSDFFISERAKKGFVESAACTLACYHRLIDGFVPAGKKRDGFMPGNRKRWQESDWYLHEFDKYKELLRGSERPTRFFRDNINRFKQDLVILGGKLEKSDGSLPRLVIHGDYGPYNLLFKGDQLAAVLDFECAHLDWRAWDVIGAIYRFAGTRTGIDLEQAGIFFAAYQSGCALSTQEIGLMPDIFRFSRLRGLTIALRDCFDLGIPSRLDDARHIVWWIDWMEENGPRLTQALLKCV